MISLWLSVLCGSSVEWCAPRAADWPAVANSVTEWVSTTTRRHVLQLFQTVYQQCKDGGLLPAAAPRPPLPRRRPLGSVLLPARGGSPDGQTSSVRTQDRHLHNVIFQYFMFLYEYELMNVQDGPDGPIPVFLLRGSGEPSKEIVFIVGFVCSNVLISLKFRNQSW